jgi:hypothetical protein
MEEQMGQQFKGKSSDAQAPILGAKFWKKGIKIEGTVLKSFQTQNGECFVISLRSPVKVGTTMEKQVAIGALKGFHMALNAAGLEDLKERDAVIIECTGVTATNKGNDRVDFNVAVNRPD